MGSLADSIGGLGHALGAMGGMMGGMVGGMGHCPRYFSLRVPSS